MDNDKIFASMQEAMTNLQPLYGDQMTSAIEASELEPPAWFTLMTMNGLTEPIQVEYFNTLNPFTRLEQVQERIDAIVEKGFAELEGDSGGYRVTKAGREAATHPFKVVHEQLDSAQPMDSKDLKRLAELLGKVVDLTIEAGKPANKPNLLRSRQTHPGSKAGPVTLIDQYITDLIYYRDDAHNGAWLPHGCSAQAWDVLTSVWRKQSQDIDSLAEQFEARGYTTESLQTAMDEIKALGWLTDSDGKLEVTQAGAKLRQETEDLTNEYYFGPWSGLSEQDQKAFEDLIVAYTDAIKPEEEPAQAS
jgi:hypothetical protein